MRRRLAIRPLAITAATLMLVVGILLCIPRTWELTGRAERTFVIDHPYDRVRQILVRTNAIREIVALNNGRLIDQKWYELDLDLAKLLTDPNWNVDAQGMLKVELHDDYVGDEQITLMQKVQIQPNLLRARNDLATPTDKLRGYSTSTACAPTAADRAEFRSAVELQIKVTTLPLWRTVAQRRVTAAAAKGLTIQEDAIRQLVDRHKDRRFILPQF